MTVTNEERQCIRSLPKRRDICPKLQAAKDKSLREALVAEFCGEDSIREPARMADLVMRIVKEQR